MVSCWLPRRALAVNAVTFPRAIVAAAVDVYIAAAALRKSGMAGGCFYMYMLFGRSISVRLIQSNV